MLRTEFEEKVSTLFGCTVNSEVSRMRGVHGDRQSVLLCGEVVAYRIEDRGRVPSRLDQVKRPGLGSVESDKKGRVVTVQSNRGKRCWNVVYHFG